MFCGAFSCCENLKTVIMPSAQLDIPEYAFYRCESLEKIDLPIYNMTEIHSNAFAECISLKEIEIPKSVWLISDCVFENRTCLEKVILNEYTNIVHNAFNGCNKLELKDLLHKEIVYYE